jgi:hypothetical protein
VGRRVVAPFPGAAAGRVWAGLRGLLRHGEWYRATEPAYRGWPRQEVVQRADRSLEASDRCHSSNACSDSQHSTSRKSPGLPMLSERATDMFPSVDRTLCRGSEPKLGPPAHRRRSSRSARRRSTCSRSDPPPYARRSCLDGRERSMAWSPRRVIASGSVGASGGIRLRMSTAKLQVPWWRLLHRSGQRASSRLSSGSRQAQPREQVVETFVAVEVW